MKRIDIWFVVGVLLVLLGILMFIGVVKAAPSYSDVGQNLTYVPMGDSIELRAKWTPTGAPYDISKATYIQSLDSKTTLPECVEFNNDGTKLYICADGDKRIHQYTLSTPYDISTATYDNYLDTSSEGSPYGMTFNDDGTKLYVAEGTNDFIRVYNLSTPYDILTATYDSYFNVSAQDTRIEDVKFNNDGTKMYVVGNGNDCIYEYNLSTPYDVSTAVYNDNLYVGDEAADITGMAFNDDGTKLYISGSGYEKIHEYILSTPYDVSTAVYSRSLDVSSESTDTTGVAFSSDGVKLFISDNGGDDIDEFVLRYALDTAILYLNLTGSFEEVDTIDLGGAKVATWSNFSYTPTTCNKVVGWKITANDSSATSNTTTIGTFYVMPYIYSGAGLTATCTNKHNATITPSTTGDINATFLAPYFVRNATFKECSYEITEDADRVKITNASEYCNITVINLEAESGTSFYLQESTELSAYPPPNLPSAIAAAGLIIIVIYTITTRRR